jgi:hypothetical protein
MIRRKTSKIVEIVEVETGLTPDDGDSFLVEFERVKAEKWGEL